MTFVLGRRVTGSPGTALVAALLLAVSPPFMFHLMQPTSDVPAAAWWLLAIVAAHDRSWLGAAGSGAAASMAVLTRPNLLPLAVPRMAFTVVLGACYIFYRRSTTGRIFVFFCQAYRGW
jgi:4-amino-4-deoxy-L-arabinose transferase-like glycosyltransferase